MSSLTLHDHKAHTFTRDEFFHMVEQGWFNDQRVEFIEGSVIDMSPTSSEHGFCVSRAQLAFWSALGDTAWVRAQLPLDLAPRSYVLPDLAIVTGGLMTHRGKDNPTQAMLVVEFSESSLSFDRNYKASLYAASGIQEYWIVNLPDRQVEVHRCIVKDPAAECGSKYSDIIISRSGDNIQPLEFPLVHIAVADLLP